MNRSCGAGPCGARRKAIGSSGGEGVRRSPGRRQKTSQPFRSLQRWGGPVGPKRHHGPATNHNQTKTAKNQKKKCQRNKCNSRSRAQDFAKFRPRLSSVLAPQVKRGTHTWATQLSRIRRIVSTIFHEVFPGSVQAKTEKSICYNGSKRADVCARLPVVLVLAWSSRS